MAGAAEFEDPPRVPVLPAIAGMLRGAFRDWRGWLVALGLVFAGNLLSGGLVLAGVELIFLPPSLPAWIQVAIAPGLSRFFRLPGHLAHMLAIGFLVARWLEDIEAPRAAVRRAMSSLVLIALWLLTIGVFIDMAVVLLEQMLTEAGAAGRWIAQALATLVRALVFASMAFLIPHALRGSTDRATPQAPGRWRGTRQALFAGLLLSSVLQGVAVSLFELVRDGLFNAPGFLYLAVVVVVGFLVRVLGIALDAALITTVARHRAPSIEQVAKVFE